MSGSTMFLYGLMFVVAASCLAHGLRAWGRALGEPRDGAEGARQAIDFVRGIRTVLSGLCVAGLALSEIYDHPGLRILSLAVGLEELYETTMALFLLKRIERHEASLGAQPV